MTLRRGRTIYTNFVDRDFDGIRVASEGEGHMQIDGG